MKITSTEIENCFIIEPEVFADGRGYFMESYNAKEFQKQTGLEVNFVQDNESKSSYGVIRGLHAQTGKYAQAKLVRVVRGKVLDIVVDARLDSPTFGNIVTALLDADNKIQLYVPKGCLHGFSVLEDETIFTYKCDALYHKNSEIGVNPLDTTLAIDWKVKHGAELISEKDQKAPAWVEFLKS